MGRTACTEPQCLYSRAIPLLPLWAVRHVQSLSACTVELYLYSPYVPYGTYRASVPVQYSYTSTPRMGRTACTEPQCLYSRAIPLLPLWTVRPVQSLSACTRVTFTFTYILYYTLGVSDFYLYCEWLSHTSVTTVTGFVPVRYVLSLKQMFLRQTVSFVRCELRMKK
jgi:hypothetical protein